ncbi:MAG: type II toxin-antitoxin system RelE family toxin [Armatimonadota bacterium]
MKYSVFLASRAIRDYRKLPKEVQERISQALEKLRENPRPHGCEKVIGSDSWRIRIGDYRIIFKVDDENKTVTVTRIGHRKDVYEV